VDKIDIPSYDALPLDAIAPGLIGLRIAFVNVFAVTNPGGTWTLIDAALPFSASHIKSWAEKNLTSPPNAIVLTHGHFDHVSAAHELAGEWNIPVFAHQLEFPYLMGEKEYPAPNWKAGGGAMSLLSPTLPKGPVDLRRHLAALPGEGSELSQMPGWKIIHTPGHTPGHVSFFREEDRTLLVGDAFCTTKAESFFEAALAQHTELHGPPSYFTSDWAAAKLSVRKLAALSPAVAAPGHGKPLGGPDVAFALRQLAEDFNRIAIPDNEKAHAQI
jgi:glyoxylase-like metal-dependent hydrolase (beta-lactamase superfamily II)